MSNYLFLFTLGPVQTFIAQARKTQDLYAGSQILSDLCRIGTKAIEQYQGKVIFPSKDNAFFPNRFLAEVPEQSTIFKEIGECVESRVRVAFESIAGTILQQRGLHKPPGFDEQIENHLDIHWTFYPIQSSYAEAYREIEKLLGAIKNLRAFKQLNGGEGEWGRKCSLDGERNALFYRKNCNRQGPPAYMQPGAIELKQGAKLGPNEALSAVSFVKRYYPTEEKFASTTKVALMDYLAQLEKQAKTNPTVKSAIFELLEIFEKKSLKKKKSLKNLEAGIFHEENLTPKYFDENDLYRYEQDIPEIRKQVATLNKFAQKNKYYAVLVFDGDSMGQWLSGKFIKDETRLQEFHQALSEKLGKFANIVAKQLVYPYGQTVYAGGDDFLGLVNLNYLFEAMMSLRQIFDGLVNQPLKEFKRTEHDNLTFSAGILIAHYKEPLHIVLQEARRLEKTAKDEGGRDAFALGVMKRSGESHQICYKWQEGEEWNVERIRFIIEQLQENFSDTFIRSLNLELSLLINENGWVENDEMVKTEMRRLIDRSVRDDQIETKLYDKLSQLWDASGKTVNFLDALNIANFLKKQIGPRDDN